MFAFLHFFEPTSNSSTGQTRSAFLGSLSTTSSERLKRQNRDNSRLEVRTAEQAGARPPNGGLRKIRHSANTAHPIGTAPGPGA